MNPIQIIFTLIAAIFLIFVIRLLSLTSLGAEGAQLPWWVYATYLGILFSGIMYVNARVDEKRKEEKAIELEGSIILDEIRNRRKKAKLNENDIELEQNNNKEAYLESK
ncbi:sporulation YhaL family protein [Bacillus shivajii]|uniref:sporulation YhaL family protein n=1 Tax=Bacillus shivajii TaxID=1983719 RepID=UPI001CF9D543|nr:sporulation YhaL family protein [Bacillus shivajii]UCZ54317.1 sporulation YhaL family protein [Bacillus shivajii]